MAISRIESITIASSIFQAIAVFASGSDVYVVGADNGAIKKKNGVESALPASSGSTSAYAMSLFVSGSDVYVGGYQSTNAISYASYWKNGVPTVSASAILSQAQFLFLERMYIWLVYKLLSVQVNEARFTGRT